VGAAIAVLGAVLALLDAALFLAAPALGYLVHHLLATAIGAALMAVSWRLLARVDGYRPVLLLDLVVGVGMVVIHLTKLAWGRAC
jgi:hypothetical protein